LRERILAVGLELEPVLFLVVVFLLDQRETEAGRT